MMGDFNSSEIPNSSGTISRQAVIDWASKIPIHDLSDGRGLCRVIFAEDFLKALEQLPSAQPEPSQCWGCNCPKMQKTFSEMVHLHDAKEGAHMIKKEGENGE